MASVTFEEQLRQAGITEDKPLHAVLVTVMQAAQDAKAAKALSERGEEALARRIDEMAVRAAERESDRRTRWARLGVLLRGMVIGAVLVGAGYGVAKWETAGFRVPVLIR